MYKYFYIIFLPSLLFAGIVEKEVRFKEPVFSKLKSYDAVTLPGYGYTSELGNPRLPRAGLNLVVPPGARVTKVEVVSFESEPLPGTYEIFPAQPPVPISDVGAYNYTPVQFVKPNTAIYFSSMPYPGKLIECTGTGTMSGYRIAGLLIYPVQYIPVKKRLIFYKIIRFRVYYTVDVNKIKRMPERKREPFAKDVKSLVINPEDVDFCRPPIKPFVGAYYNTPLPPGDWEYVMVVANSSDSAIFDEVRAWKHKKGIPATIVLRDFIYTNYSGADEQEKIKNFVADAETTWGASWFVMCGDVNVIPIKKLYTGDSIPGEPIPSDHYYADTDPIPGPLQPDYEDVWVSRASIASPQECSTFVKKTLRYEKDPSFGYTQTFAYFPSCTLWIYYLGYSADTIANITPTPPWLDSIRYEWEEFLSTAEIQESFNSGIYFCHVSAHGGPEGWGHSEVHEKHQIDDVDVLTNFPNLFIFNAICCDIGELDWTTDDCYTEHMANNPNGGTAGIIGNSRYGFGGYGFQEDGSEGYDAEFYRQICWNDIYNFAKAEGMAHNAKVPVAQADDHSEYCMYDHVPLGDPEMPMWTHKPALLYVNHASVIQPVSQNFFVEVKDGGGSGVPDARVCLMSEDVYERGHTDSSGQVTLPISPSSPGTLWVTVTTHNFIPYEGYATIEVGVEEASDLPLTYGISVHPNPCVRKVGIKYQLPKAGKVELKIYDISGRLVKTLVDESKKAGYYKVEWFPKRSGIYFLRIRAGSFRRVKKTVVIM